MRSRCLLILLVTLAAISSTTTLRAQSGGAAVLTPGLWEITVQTTSPVAAAPMSHTVCIDKLHVTKPEPPKSKASDDCKVLPDAAAANETAYTVHCGKKKTTSTSRFTYSGDHFSGTLTVQTPGSDEVKQVYTAVRIGDCDEQPDPNPTPAPPAH
jgi:hypothetical protein